jgi:hypothetical protein
MSHSWRDHILQVLTPQVARLLLVADPDGLLLEEGILQGLQARGYELLSYEDPVAFRFTYESTYRSRWDQGEGTERNVILRTEAAELRSLPYDLLQAGQQHTFTLGDLFPKLSYPVVAALDRSDFDALYRAQRRHHPGTLGENDTKDFVLRHVFDIAPELIKEPADLLRVLLRRHYRKRRVPAMLDAHLVQLLQRHGQFQDWPLERIVPDREAFLSFLQQRWPRFLKRWLQQHQQPDMAGAAAELASEQAMVYVGSEDLPFDHDDVRVYIDNLFLEGHLKPLAATDLGVHLERFTLPAWLAVGLRLDPASDRLRRLQGFLASLASSIPVPHAARHYDWCTFAQRWAEFLALWHQAHTPAQPELSQRFREVQGQVDTAFLTWVQQRYGGLHNLPAAQPAMLHHIPRYLAHEICASHSAKFALVLLDGLALDQWVVLREVLTQQRPQMRLQEAAVLAWIPTITSVSRQAAFAGKPPMYYPASIHSTDKEKALWEHFWQMQGLQPGEIAYARGLGAEADLATVADSIGHPKVRVVGLVVDTVDTIMHGMALGASGMHNQVRQWAEEGCMTRLLDLLFDHGYTVFLTSDHGNIEAVGCGRPAEGALADLRGERVRVYTDPTLRARVQARFPEAIAWPAIGLPADYLPLLAPGRSAFVQEGERIVGHGGITLEEVVVPFIRIERRGV